MSDFPCFVKLLHFLTSGAYRIMDQSERGADIKRIEETLLEAIGEEHIEEDDYVLIEGGGNGFTRIGVNETFGTIERMVKKATDKVKGKVVVMNIPMRRGKENGLFGKTRRTVNIKCMEKLEEWDCDAIQLNEGVDWEKVWGRDGVHLRFKAQQWLAMIAEEWMRTRNKETTRNIEEDGECTA